MVSLSEVMQSESGRLAPNLGIADLIRNPSIGLSRRHVYSQIRRRHSKHNAQNNCRQRWVLLHFANQFLGRERAFFAMAPGGGFG